jgi:pilus assembly protein CpaF
VFGKRSDADTAPVRKAPPPPPAGAPIATRPQSDQGSTASGTPATKREGADTASLAGGSTPRENTKAPRGLDQLRAAQSPTAQIVREQSDYYHATKTTIFNALLNTIDLSQLAQLDQKSAAEEIKDIVAELVAIKNVSMSVAETDHLVQDIINPRRHRRRDGQRRQPGVHRSRRQGPADQRPVPRQRPADEHLPADRQPGRPPGRRELADL